MRLLSYFQCASNPAQLSTRDHVNQTARIFVAYPRIAQGDVNKSTLDITRMEISNPTPDSFHLAQAQTLGSKSFFHPTIFSFGAAVSLAGSFRSFGSVTVPQVKAENGVTVRIDQDLRVTDKTALVDFAKTALLNETVGLNVHGKPKLRLGALQKIKVTYDKTVRIKGIPPFSRPPLYVIQ